MNKLSHGIVGIVLFSILMTSIVSFHSGVKTSYVPTADLSTFENSADMKDGKNIGQKLSEITVMQYLTVVSNQFQTIQTGSTGDIIGALLISLAGGIIALLGVFIAPFEIAHIMSDYYAWIPPFFLEGLLTIMLIYVLIAYKKSTTQQGGL